MLTEFVVCSAFEAKLTQQQQQESTTTSASSALTTTITTSSTTASTTSLQGGGGSIKRKADAIETTPKKQSKKKKKDNSSKSSSKTDIAQSSQVDRSLENCFSIFCLTKSKIDKPNLFLSFLIVSSIKFNLTHYFVLK